MAGGDCHVSRHGGTEGLHLMHAHTRTPYTHTHTHVQRSYTHAHTTHTSRTSTTRARWVQEGTVFDISAPGVASESEEFKSNFFQARVRLPLHHWDHAHACPFQALELLA